MFRYVILRHEMPATLPRDSHWDFMIEAGDVLFCWALRDELKENALIAAERLADHRKMYLDYEGPISDGRGVVSRWDAGVYQPQTGSGDGLRLEVQGQRLAGTVDIQPGTDEAQPWTFRYWSGSS